MIDIEWARAFAEEWIAAWNTGDLERILSHYTDDFEMTSPLIVEGMGIASGKLKGKDAVQPYWAKGLALKPPLKFELLDVFAGAYSIAIHYRSTTRGRVAIEYLEFGPDGLVIRAEALSRAEA